MYNWSNGTSTQTLSITNTGCFTVTTTDVNGCTATSLPYCINYLPGVPTPVIISTDSALCAGETSLVSCSTCPTSGINYLWSNNSNASSFSVANAVCLTLSISDINGCSSTSNSYCISNLPTPATPIISFDNNSGTLTASTISDSYVWYLNGGLTALTSQTITPTNNGDYSVIATSNNGCISDTSTNYTYLFTGISSRDVMEGFNLYPNPSNDDVNVDIANSSEVLIQIYDMAGQDVYIGQFSNQSGNIHERINLSNLSVGVYHVKVSYNGKVKALKLVKAN
jgi:Secretion system C-terminal sorting domain